MKDSKKLIMDSFWTLLEEKPYHKITVKMIAERCGINRNTFYYYFQDIPSLTGEILKKQVDLLIEKHCRVGSLTECVSSVVEFLTKYKQVALHLYRSVSRDIFIKHLSELLYYLVSMYIGNLITALKIEVENKELLVRFFKCLLVGAFLDWLEDDMAYDMLKDYLILCNQQKGIGFEFLLNASIKDADR